MIDFTPRFCKGIICYHSTALVIMLRESRADTCSYPELRWIVSCQVGSRGLPEDVVLAEPGRYLRVGGSASGAVPSGLAGGAASLPGGVWGLVPLCPGARRGPTRSSARARLATSRARPFAGHTRDAALGGRGRRISPRLRSAQAQLVSCLSRAQDQGRAGASLARATGDGRRATAGVSRYLRIAGSAAGPLARRCDTPSTAVWRVSRGRNAPRVRPVPANRR